MPRFPGGVFFSREPLLEVGKMNDHIRLPLFPLLCSLQNTRPINPSSQSDQQRKIGPGDIYISALRPILFFTIHVSNICRLCTATEETDAIGHWRRGYQARD